MTNISSMERYIPAVQPTKANAGSDTNKAKDSANSFNKQLNDAVDSSKASGNKKPQGEQEKEDSTKETKGQETVPVEGLLLTDITQPILLVEGNEAEQLLGFAQRTAAAVVPVLHGEQDAVPPTPVQQTEAPVTPALPTQALPTEALPITQEAKNISVKPEAAAQDVTVQGQTDTRQSGLTEIQQPTNQQSTKQQSENQQSGNQQQSGQQERQQPQIRQPVNQTTPGQNEKPAETVAPQNQTPVQTQDANLARDIGTVQRDLTGQKVTYQAENPADVKTTDGPVTVVQDLAMVKQGQLDPAATIKIKVAEPYTTMDPEAVKQLAARISEGVSKGSKELTIQLTPENLGKISIRIATESEGIKVIVSCENPKTLGLLTDKATGIGHIVENNLNQQTVVEIKEDGYWNQQKNATDQQSNQNGRQQEEQDNNSRQKDETGDFIQQLRLGMQGDKAAV